MKGLLLFGVCSALAGVILGAFAAHGLRDVLSTSMQSTFETGVRYQMYHALALLALPGLSAHADSRYLVRGGRLFVAGTLLFSGSLYLLATLNLTVLGPVTPAGGLCFIVGWLFVLVAVWRGKQ
ncbi:DUF423 domain-containing protein [Alteromonas halophila]|uniref:DUF423 domain-containing protein n=1 Tax=Alteromonas halophila TaxID=516698 RepID=A0A918JDS8_9ALTE|nr:DUF423 domain-containing protein [Alteromonas halophila]GGW76040.1 DUF423 domain-containing protein [Alteromonas halophila]